MLIDKIFTEKYRPNTFEDLVFENKALILNHLKKPLAMPSFVFHSNHPGTGKTSTAKLIIKTLNCDSLIINASDERGIDTIRDKITIFSRSMSSNPNTKRCVFMDEADSITKVAQDSLRATMEEFSDNVFFIFSCNDISKVIEPIQSRCIIINFEKPNKADIINRLTHICELEQIQATDKDIEDLMENTYPDMRSMIKALQTAKIENKPLASCSSNYLGFFNALKNYDINYIYNTTYSSDFDVFGFNRWFFTYLFNNMDKFKKDLLVDIAVRLAEIEKNWQIGANVNVIFLAHMLQIAKMMKQ